MAQEEGSAHLIESLEEALSRAFERVMRHQERVMIFIDGPNLYTTLRKLGQKVDYFKLAEELARGRRLIRVYIYTTYNPEKPDEKEGMERFRRTLEFGGSFVVKPIPKHRKFINEGGEKRQIWVEKGVDVALVTDMLKLAYSDAYDTAILISGDADFVEAVRAVQERGKKVEVVMFSHVVSPELKRVADAFMELSYLLPKVRLEGWREGSTRGGALAGEEHQGQRD